MTIQYGRPFRFDVVPSTTREQQQEAADYIFAQVRELHDELERVGHKGAMEAARARARRGGAAVARS